jgi:hypothetical protein
MKKKVLITVAAIAMSSQLLASTTAKDNKYVALSSGQMDLGKNTGNTFYRLAGGKNKYFYHDHLLFGYEGGVLYAPNAHNSKAVHNKDAYDIDAEAKLGGHIDKLNLDLYGTFGVGYMYYNEAEFQSSTMTYEDTFMYATQYTVGVGAQWFYDDWLIVNTAYKSGKMTPSTSTQSYDYSSFNIGIGYRW